jgi:predicted transcriptional regulator of viral defense system
MARKGIHADNRERLELISRRFNSPFSVGEASALLGLEAHIARHLLVQLTNQGWLTRLRRNVYRTVPLGASNPAEWREDPWLVAAHAFAPCYLAGWTACEHWGFTEQLFRDVVVVTCQRVRHREVEIQDTRYLLHVRKDIAFFGIKNVWRAQVSVPVSDPTRTLIDLLDTPAMGGGIRAVADCLAGYWHGPHCDVRLLLDYAGKIGNRTVFKRLGYLVETLKLDSPDLTAGCLSGLSRGVSLLDPTGPATGRILKRWNLRLNVNAFHGF